MSGGPLARDLVVVESRQSPPPYPSTQERAVSVSKTPSSRDAPPAKVSHLSLVADRRTDEELLDLVLSGHPEAAGHVYDRFAPVVNRVVWKLLGADPDHGDLVHDIFMKVWTLMAQGRVKHPDRLNSWVIGVAVNTVHKEIRRRTLRRRFLREEAAPAPSVNNDHHEARDLLNGVYGILERIPPDERLAFSLRYLEQQRLTEVAQLCRCSLATVKRRLARAEKRFALLARRYPAIVELLHDRNWGGDA
jgi:RNA polymerase sigma-70 factor (ECF subfamily)